MANGILQKVQKLPEELKKAFLTQFAQWAQLNGLNIQELQLNPQALEEAMTAFVQAMQGPQQQQPTQTVSARLGAKLNYIRDIKGGCPEGQEVVYFKKGGLVCKKCVEKGAAGAEAKAKGMDAVKAFKDKCGSKMKKKACGGSKMKFQPGGKTRTKAEQAKIDSLSQADYDAGFADHNVKYTVKKEEKKPVKKEVKKVPVKKPAKKMLGGLLGF